MRKIRRELASRKANIFHIIVFPSNLYFNKDESIPSLNRGTVLLCLLFLFYNCYSYLGSLTIGISWRS